MIMVDINRNNVLPTHMIFFNGHGRAEHCFIFII